MNETKIGFPVCPLRNGADGESIIESISQNGWTLIENMECPFNWNTEVLFTAIRETIQVFLNMG